MFLPLKVLNAINSPGKSWNTGHKKLPDFPKLEKYSLCNIKSSIFRTSQKNIVENALENGMFTDGDSWKVLE